MWWMEKVWSGYYKGEYEGEIARSSYFYPCRTALVQKRKRFFWIFSMHTNSHHTVRFS